MHETRGTSIRRLRTTLNRVSDVAFSAEEKALLSLSLDNADLLYNLYGGKIFAVGQVSGSPFYVEPEEGENLFFRGRVFAYVEHIQVLDNPVSIDEFRSFLPISRGIVTTPVLGATFDRLRDKLAEKNILPPYLQDARVATISLDSINKDTWQAIAQEYNFGFRTEAQFRAYYVDYLLTALSDDGKIYKECFCGKRGKAPARVDTS